MLKPIRVAYASSSVRLSCRMSSVFRRFVLLLDSSKSTGERPLQLVDAADSNIDSATVMTILSNRSLYRWRDFFFTRETSCHFMSIFFYYCVQRFCFVRLTRNHVSIFDSFHFLHMYIFHWFYHGNDLLICKKGPSFSYYISPLFLKKKSN